ncbi:MafI family immunity protein [Paraneptunicella aestuarii]|uniref:MafI family immunity protein n=1 Tax=Paraneptunicella aestuarii TaxID=2831148 RepID=UPI001E45A6C1|nr:MafI family immunity protein [Paraneptunicella aestuarii]UAA37617.1 MafI family immunity protein [Paraneptunicella aestuarii]
MKDKVLKLLVNLSTKLPENDIENIRELVEHGEWGVGVELLCSQLHEHEIVINEIEFQVIKGLVADMELSSDLWMDIEYLVSPP